MAAPVPGTFTAGNTCPSISGDTLVIFVADWFYAPPSTESVTGGAGTWVKAFAQGDGTGAGGDSCTAIFYKLITAAQAAAESGTTYTFTPPTLGGDQITAVGTVTGHNTTSPIVDAKGGNIDANPPGGQQPVIIATNTIANLADAITIVSGASWNGGVYSTVNITGYTRLLATGNEFGVFANLTGRSAGTIGAEQFAPPGGGAEYRVAVARITIAAAAGGPTADSPPPERATTSIEAPLPEELPRKRSAFAALIPAVLSVFSPSARRRAVEAVAEDLPLRRKPNTSALVQVVAAGALVLKLRRLPDEAPVSEPVQRRRWSLIEPTDEPIFLQWMGYYEPIAEPVQRRLPMPILDAVVVVQPPLELRRSPVSELTGEALPRRLQRLPESVDQPPTHPLRRIADDGLIDRPVTERWMRPESVDDPLPRQLARVQDWTPAELFPERLSTPRPAAVVADDPPLRVRIRVQEWVDPEPHQTRLATPWVAPVVVADDPPLRLRNRVTEWTILETLPERLSTPYVAPVVVADDPPLRLRTRVQDWTAVELLPGRLFTPRPQLADDPPLRLRLRVTDWTEPEPRPSRLFTPWQAPLGPVDEPPLRPRRALLEPLPFERTPYRLAPPWPTPVTPVDQPPLRQLRVTRDEPGIDRLSARLGLPWPSVDQPPRRPPSLIRDDGLVDHLSTRLGLPVSSVDAPPVRRPIQVVAELVNEPLPPRRSIPWQGPVADQPPLRQLRTIVDQAAEVRPPALRPMPWLAPTNDPPLFIRSIAREPLPFEFLPQRLRFILPTGPLPLPVFVYPRVMGISEPFRCEPVQRRAPIVLPTGPARRPLQPADADWTFTVDGDDDYTFFIKP